MMRKILLAILFIAITVVGVILFFVIRKSTDGIDSPITNMFQRETIVTRPPEQTEVYAFITHFMLREKPKYPEIPLNALIYFGLTLNSDGTIVRESEDGADPGYSAWSEGEILASYIKKAQKGGQKLGLTVALMDNTEIETFLACTYCQQVATNEIVMEMNRHKASLVVIDIEYTGIAATDLRQKMTNFVSMASSAIHQAIPGSEVMIATFANGAYRQRIHDLSAITPLVDRIFIMAYDFNPISGDAAGPVSPLGGAPETYRYDLIHMVADYLSIVPADKLIMGIPFYAHSYLTESDYLGSFRVPGTDETGFSKVVYLSSCSENQQNNATSSNFDALSQTPWFSYTDSNNQLRQCYFEDSRSITAKMKLVADNKLKGVGVWAIGLEGNDHELWKVIDDYKPIVTPQ